MCTFVHTWITFVREWKKKLSMNKCNYRQELAQTCIFLLIQCRVRHSDFYPISGVRSIAAFAVDMDALRIFFYK